MNFKILHAVGLPVARAEGRKIASGAVTSKAFSHYLMSSKAEKDHIEANSYDWHRLGS